LTEEYRTFITDNYKKLVSDVENIRVRLGIKDEIQICAAVKTVGTEAINCLAEAGLKRIGENRVNEIDEKFGSYDGKLELDFIGTLQTNKIKKLVGRVSMIQSLHSVEAAKIIDKISEERGVVTDVLLEINSAGEEGKSGVFPENAEEVLCQIAELKNIRPRGLMTIGAAGAEFAERRKCFLNVNRIFIDIFIKKFNNIDSPVLSMGMSDSYELAIECGSNMIRPGSILFGKRNYL